MNLDSFLEYMCAEKQQFEERVKNKARSLRLKDVTERISLDSSPFFEKDINQTKQHFSKGNSLQFLLPNGHYTVFLDRTSLVLQGSYGISIKTFSGKSIASLYDNFTTEILREVEEHQNVH